MRFRFEFHEQRGGIPVYQPTPLHSMPLALANCSHLVGPKFAPPLAAQLPLVNQPVARMSVHTGLKSSELHAVTAASYVLNS